jgi:hypothetical protein
LKSRLLTLLLNRPLNRLLNRPPTRLLLRLTRPLRRLKAPLRPRPPRNIITV